MVCPNCNAQNPEDALFCQNCGVALNSVNVQQAAPQPEPQIPEADPNQTTVLVAEVTEMPVPAMPNMPSVYEAYPQEIIEYVPMEKKKKGWKFYGLISGAAAIFVILVITVVLILVSAFSTKNPLIYISDNQILIHNNNSKTPTIATSSFFKESSQWDSVGEQNVSSYLSNLIKLNKRGDRMFYISDISSSDTDVTLYYCNTQSGKSGGSDQGIKIASNVSIAGSSAFTIDNKGDHAFYMKDYSSDSGGKLYVSNLKEETSVDRDVVQYWYLESASKICYLKSDGSGDDNLYLSDINMKNDAEKIDSDVSSVIGFTDNDSKIYYTKNSGDDNNAITLYCKANGKDKVKIVSDINSIESKIENGNFYYTKADEKQIDLSTLVDDDLASSDASMAQPVYPNISAYEKQTPYTDYWGYTSYTTTLDSTGYYNAIDAYNTAEIAYSAKQQRDTLRGELQGQTYIDTQKELYVMKNGKSTRVSSNFNQALYTTSKQNTMVYSKIDMGHFDKIKIENITDISSLEMQYENSVNASTSTSISINGGSEINAFDSDANISHAVLSNDGKTLYCIERSSSDENTGDFLSYDIGSGKLQNKKTVDHDVSSFSTFTDTSNIYYYKDIQENSGDLYILSNGKGKKISSDVNAGSCTFYAKDNMLLFISGYSGTDGTGTLNMYKGNTKTKIADDIKYYFYEGKSGICYLSDYETSKGTGDLKQYVNANKSNLISEDVNAVLPMSGGDFF